MAGSSIENALAGQLGRTVKTKCERDAGDSKRSGSEN